jgi:hydroxyacylglutathione hydrolase
LKQGFFLIISDFNFETGKKMLFQRIYNAGLSINSYVIGDKESGTCCVIDPVRLVTPYIVIAENAGLSITHILETHVHADFVSGSKELKHQLDGKPLIYASGLGGEKWIPSYADYIVKEGDIVKTGSIRLEAVHTPGHTPEHLTWIVYDESRSRESSWFAFTGDFLFVGGVGRPDLFGKDEYKILSKQLYDSLFKKMILMPDFLGIFPAHGEGSLCGKSMSGCASSTLGYEKRFNPYFAEQPEEKWFERIGKDLPQVPPYLKRVKKINLEGAPILGDLSVESIQENVLDGFVENQFFLDVRHPGAYAQFHIKGSINIPGTSSFSTWAGWFVPESIPIVIITESESRIKDTIDQLRLLGYDQPISTCILHPDENQHIQEWTSLTTITVDDLANRQNEENVPYVLDVRSKSEWASGHIPGAHHIELQRLCECMHTLPEEVTIGTVCSTGQRSSLAASLLKKFGFKNVFNIKGGMTAWKQAAFPTEGEK